MTDPKDRLKARLKAAQKLQAWALESESARHINAALDLARSEPGIPVLSDDLDSDPWALNCVNGTLDLRTGELRPHRREDLITKLCPTPYHPTARCPLWEQTVLAVLGGNGDLATYFQRLLGYAATGDVREDILAILWGSGSNGKSLIVNTIMSVLGADYAMQATQDLFMARRGDSHPTAQADLFGKRFVACVETAEGGRLNEVMVKQLTGRDRIRARRMREDHWEFSPTHKLFLVTNHKPEVKGNDTGIWRRLRLIPFTVKFWDPQRGEDGPAELEADKTLEDKFKAEHAGILAWMVRGCLDWQRDGLATPEEVLHATGEYRIEQDLVQRFITEECVTGSASYRTRGGALYEAFRRWCEAAGEEPVKSRRFGETLGEKGFHAERSGGVWRVGITLRN